VLLVTSSSARVELVTSFRAQTSNRLLLGLPSSRLSVG
jgi:hypothetical protein